MAKKRKALPALSAAEREVMKVIWEHGPMAARDVYSHLPPGQGWGYATVKTLLRRAVRKGWLDYDQIGNSFLYRAAVPRERAVFAAAREFTSRVLDGVLAPFVAYFAKEKGLTRQDLDQLEEILRRHRRKEGRRHDS